MDYQNREEMEAYLESLMAEYPVCEYAFGDCQQIEFSDKVYTICETDCKRYNKSWACPPNAGTIQKNIKRIGNYQHFFLFSTVWEVSDAMNFDACLLVRKEHETIVRDMRSRILKECGLSMTSLEEEAVPSVYFLSSGCSICEECSCPNEACRHPKERLMSAESHGILLIKLVEDMGLTASFDGTTVVYFSMVLYGSE